MAGFRSRVTEASQRFAERRRREDEAPRLLERVPELTHLKLEVEERRAASMAADSKHVRHVVVDRAPALFYIPCGDPACKDGGHDVTNALMRGLTSRDAHFETEDTCSGSIGTAPCGRVVRVIATATFQ
jgi:hypothetical protein